MDPVLNTLRRIDTYLGSQADTQPQDVPPTKSEIKKLYGEMYQINPLQHSVGDNGKSCEDFAKALGTNAPLDLFYVCLPKAGNQPTFKLNSHPADANKCALYVFNEEEFLCFYACTNSINIQKVSSYSQDNFNSGCIKTLVRYDRLKKEVRFYMDDQYKFEFTFATGTSFP